MEQAAFLLDKKNQQSNHIDSTDMSESNIKMTRTDDTCSQIAPAVAMEENPKHVDIQAESFYRRLSPNLKQDSESLPNTDFDQGTVSLVPDIDRPCEPIKKSFINRYEASNASRDPEDDTQPTTVIPSIKIKRPAVIQYAPPSMGYQNSEVHDHVQKSFDSTVSVNARVTKAVTHSVPVHSRPVMSGWAKDMHSGSNKHDSHTNHEELQSDAELTFETKYHCQESKEMNVAVDLTTTRSNTFRKTNFTTARSNLCEEALDLSVPRKSPSPPSSSYSESSIPLSPTSSSTPLTPISSTSFTEKFQALSTADVVSAPNQLSQGYVDLNRLKEIYTHNMNALVKSQAHDPNWNDNIQNPNTTKIYPRATMSNGVKAAPVTVNVQNTESGKMYQCQLCNVMFKHRHHVVRHMRSHTGEKPFHCQECGARFARKCILTNHMRVHTGEKPFICRECGDMFSRKHHLVIHVRTHTGEKPYCCGKCGAAFSRSHHLGRHMKTHETKQGLDGSENTVDQYQCTKCPAKFAHPNSLSRHVKNHNSPNFESRLMPPASSSTVYTSEAATPLTHISHRPLPSSTTVAYPISSTYALPYPSLTAVQTPLYVADSTNQIKTESSVFYTLDSIPVPRTDVVIPPSSGLTPMSSVLASLTMDHSTVVKEEISDVNE
ncbi:early growth response protein 1-A-like [Anneissia japonica]|uniref:early growth response protein 1-A-like n=1 Tax=Anneissia japonica TaxID=1529436 RepID=UPI0014259F85|nr:early growth response protein 1-A-like [Anneissia japonica]